MYFQVWMKDKVFPRIDDANDDQGTTGTICVRKGKGIAPFSVLETKES